MSNSHPKHPGKSVSVLLVAAVLLLIGWDISNADALVIFEAESGILGSSFVVRTDGSPQYITSTNNNTANNPGSAARVASYTVAFPEPGPYKPYVRVRVGPENANKDSSFYGNGFGAKTPTTPDDWILVNSINSGGFTNPADVVTGSGTAGIQVWKWINLSEYTGTAGEQPVTFTVPPDNLVQTFQLGGREDGLDIDKVAFGRSGSIYTVQELDLGSNVPPVIGQRDLVAGNLIQFNDNRAWCWFQYERAVVDTAHGKIVVGSVASDNGRGGAPREGDVEVSIFDLATGTPRVYTLRSGDTHPSVFYADDHNAPGLLVLPNGHYLAIYAGHNTEKFCYWRVFDGTSWSEEQRFDWNSIPGGADFNTTYSNPHYMAAEGGRIYNFARTHFHGSPNLITSDDLGQTWVYRGVLATNQNVGYVNGYFHYWGNGIDRIDFICTEYHPDNFNTSIYHGYVSNGMSFRSDGTVVDSVLYDQVAPCSSDFTPVFVAGTVMPPGQTNTRCWTCDLVRYNDGTVAALLKTRVNDRTDNDSDPKHAFFYAWWDGTSWSWTPITWKSVRDNLRPIMPKWDRNNRVLLWWRGDYSNPSAAQNFDTAVVGIIERNSEQPTQVAYVDATLQNTTLSDGTPLVRTGPSTNAGAADNQWHERIGVGNGDSVLTSAELGGEDAPILATTVILPEAGTHDLWVNFWGRPGADWRIKAGLTTNRMQVFRQMACKQVEAYDHRTALVITNIAENAYLYQAYVGRVTVTTNTAVCVFVDDEPVATGTTGPLIDNAVRT